jgi:VanZ family protein
VTRHRSSAVPLAWLYAGLIVYASLYPFGGWRWPVENVLAFLVMPWPRWWSGFDLVSNLLGYLPLGLLVFGARVRGGVTAAAAARTALAAAAALSLTMEVVQHGLPHRVPSNVDLALNVAGGAGGAALGLLIHWLGGIERWHSLRQRWFIERSAGGLVLLLLWPFGLLFPTPVPLALGQVAERAHELLAEAVEGTAADAWFASLPAAAPAGGGLSPAAEVMLVACGLLAPCLVAYTIARPGWRRLVLAGGAAALGFSAMTLSTAMNFGPDHAFAWRTPNGFMGQLLGVLGAALLAPAPRRIAAGLGLVVLTAMVLLVAQAPADPYFAASLQNWEQGRFIRFHGAAQWIGWVWPYVAVVYMLVRVAARDDMPDAPSPGHAGPAT